MSQVIKELKELDSKSITMGIIYLGLYTPLMPMSAAIIFVGIVYISVTDK